MSLRLAVRFQLAQHREGHARTRPGMIPRVAISA
jgi:hypothetical protein